MEVNEPSAHLNEAPLSSQHCTDLELVDSLQSGQLGALQTIYQRYSRLVYTLSYRLLSSREEAEEVTQDVFLTLWEKGGYRPERGGLSGYLTMMAKSRAIDRVRSRSAHHKRLHKWHMKTQAIAATPPLEFASLTERIHCVQQALTNLSTKERKILEIAYYDGLSQSEISQRLDIPLGTVKTCSRRALKKLRHALRDVL